MCQDVSLIGETYKPVISNTAVEKQDIFVIYGLSA
jgi:hypothetical protein